MTGEEFEAYFSEQIAQASKRLENRELCGTMLLYSGEITMLPFSILAYNDFISRQVKKVQLGISIKCSPGLMAKIKKRAIGEDLSA